MGIGGIGKWGIAKPKMELYIMNYEEYAMENIYIGGCWLDQNLDWCMLAGFPSRVIIPWSLSHDF